MKMALQFWMNQGVMQRRRFLAFEGAYHGDTFAAMSVCDPAEGMHRKFAGSLLEQAIVPLPRTDDQFAVFETFLQAHAPELAALIIEPLLQAAGGFIVHSPETLERIVRIARRHDLLVIFDEIATGFGRTGTMFACEQAGVVPDVITLSKALTGGTVPLAATVANERIYKALPRTRRWTCSRPNLASSSVGGLPSSSNMS